MHMSKIFHYFPIGLYPLAHVGDHDFFQIFCKIFNNPFNLQQNILTSELTVWPKKIKFWASATRKFPFAKKKVKMPKFDLAFCKTLMQHPEIECVYRKWIAGFSELVKQH